MFLRVLRHMPQSQRAHFIIRTRVIAAIGNIRPYSPISFQPHPAPFSHNFSSTTRVRAVEDPDAFISGFKNTSLFKKLADKPEALQALDRFSKLLRKAGKDRSLLYLGNRSTVQIQPIRYRHHKWQATIKNAAHQPG